MISFSCSFNFCAIYHIKKWYLSNVVSHKNAGDLIVEDLFLRVEKCQGRVIMINNSFNRASVSKAIQIFLEIMHIGIKFLYIVFSKRILIFILMFKFIHDLLNHLSWSPNPSNIRNYQIYLISNNAMQLNRHFCILFWD